MLSRAGAAVAASVGFGSAETFSRSFKALFGRTPGDYRQSSGSLALMNPFGPEERPLAHRASCLREEPRVQLYGLVRLAAKSRVFALEDPLLAAAIQAFWREVEAELAAARGLAPGVPLARSYGLAEPEPGREGRCIRYLAGVEIQADSRSPDGLSEYRIPHGEYLLARHRGPLARLNETYLYLYGTWLPRAGRLPGAAMEFDF